MGSRRAPCHEGDWFGVPLPSGKYAVGLAARVSARGYILGYFFGPALKHLPSLDDLALRKAEDAVYLCRFSDLGLKEHGWPVIGHQNPWQRELWPMPAFGFVLAEIGLACIRYYAHDDPSSFVLDREIQCSPAEAATLPEDGWEGHEFVIQKLERLLG